MRTLVCVLLLAGAADAAPRFVVTKWNPGKPFAKVVAPGAVETPSDAADVAPVATDCGCTGDESKCQCERGNCRCTSCPCKTCGAAKTELTPQMQAKVAALETDGIWWDENYLTECQKPVYRGTQERRKIHVFVPSWCPHCPKTKVAMGDGDDEIELVYHKEVVGVQGAKYYPAYWNPRAKEFYYNVRLDANGKATSAPWIDNSLENLKAEIGITDSVVGAISAGEIKREAIEKLLPLLGWFRGAGLKNDPRDIPLGPVTLALPGNFGVDWSTTSGTTKFVPTEAPSIKWSFLLNKKINFVTYNGDQIEFDIPKLPNMVLKITGPKTVNSILPETLLPAMPTAEVKPLATDDAAPTPLAEINRVLGLLPKPEVAFIDFGCGSEARWCIAAAEKWRCRVIGIEIDPARAVAARKRVWNLGLDHLITIVEGDVEFVDVRGDVAVAYLYPDLLTRLKPRLQQFKAVATYMHNIPGLPMQQTGDSWVYRQAVVAAPVQSMNHGAVWGGAIYNGPVCNSRNCQMCNSIRRQMGM